MDLTSSPRWEVGVATFFVVACALILWETRTIPPGTFEPLGSAPVPQVTAVLIMLLSISVGLNGWRKLRAQGPSDGAVADEGVRPLDAWLVGALTVVYVIVLDARVIDFAPLTAIYLFTSIALLTRARLKSLIPAAVVAIIIGWGTQYLFTRVFVVDLPGL